MTKQKPCIVCSQPIPKQRQWQHKKTCSYKCGMTVAVAWSTYISKHRDQLMKAALEEHQQ